MTTTLQGDRPFWVTIEPATIDDPYWSQTFEIIANAIKYKPNFGIRLAQDQKGHGRWFYQVQSWQPDFQTGEWKLWNGGKAYLSPHAGKSELVQTIFGLFKGFEEHECREMFRYAGRRVFGPHIDVTALWEIARRIEVRDTEGEAPTYENVPDAPGVDSSLTDLKDSLEGSED